MLFSYPAFQPKHTAWGQPFRESLRCGTQPQVRCLRTASNVRELEQRTRNPQDTDNAQNIRKLRKISKNPDFLREIR